MNKTIELKKNFLVFSERNNRDAWGDELNRTLTKAKEQGAEEERENRKQLLLSVNIVSLVAKMKEEIQEHGDMHGKYCPVNMEDPDECECEEMDFWGSQIEYHMTEVNDWWARHAQAHRKYCTPEGNKTITRMLGKKNRNLKTLTPKK